MISLYAVGLKVSVFIPNPVADSRWHMEIAIRPGEISVEVILEHVKRRKLIRVIIDEELKVVRFKK